jgi:hypothetical protein
MWFFVKKIVVWLDWDVCDELDMEPNIFNNFTLS